MIFTGSLKQLCTVGGLVQKSSWTLCWSDAAAGNASWRLLMPKEVWQLIRSKGSLTHSTSTQNIWAGPVKTWKIIIVLPLYLWCRSEPINAEKPGHCRLHNILWTQHKVSCNSATSETSQAYNASRDVNFGNFGVFHHLPTAYVWECTYFGTTA